MKLILSHPTGNAFVRAAANGFLEKGMLLNFNTAIASFPGSVFDHLGGFGLLSEIRRRRFDPSLKPVTNIWPLMELARLFASKAGLESLIKHEKGRFCVDAVYRNLDLKVASVLNSFQKKGANAVYAYEDGAIASFKAAKKLGLDCVYDLPIGYWRAARELLEKECEKKPEWAATICGFNDSEEKLANKDKELELADRIIVASQFTATTLKLYPGKLGPIKVIPYAFPEVSGPKDYRKLNSIKPLKLLFVGGLSQRKGIAYLFEAIKTFNDQVELTIVGQKPVSNCSALNAALSKHKWIPSMPHEKVLKLMKEHDVLVFPSLFEGFGLVITEAMSQGTPVITTNRTAGPDLIEHEENGWIVEAGSSQAIQEVIEQILKNPEIIEKTGRAALETAKKRTWDKYGEELANALLYR